MESPCYWYGAAWGLGRGLGSFGSSFCKFLRGVSGLGELEEWGGAEERKAMIKGVGDCVIYGL